MKFKSILALIALSVYCHQSSFAQSRLGFFAGTTSANFEFSPDLAINTESFTGLNAGLVYDQALSTNTALSIALMYHEKGGYFPDERVNLKLGYSEASLALKILLGNGALQPYFQVGLYSGQLSSARGVDGNRSANIKEAFKTVDFGIIGGLGFRIGVFFIEGKYTKGLGNILTENLGLEIFTQSIQFNGGISIPLN